MSGDVWGGAHGAQPTSMDAIAFLTAEHRRIDDLFTQFEKAGPRAYKTKQRLVDSMIEQLSLHAGIEE
ncbi:MAG: hypothetical protein ACRDZY_03635, partial [Acidimicrobiales bacterium]